MAKSLKNLNKKAAYDLGRKAIYFMVAIIIIALIFVYVSNSIQSYQLDSREYLKEVTYLTQVEAIEKCISKIDNNRIYLGELNRLKLDLNSIKNCLEKDETIGKRDFRIIVEGQQPIQTTNDPIDYESYERHFLFQKEIKKITIEVEKIEIPT